MIMKNQFIKVTTRGGEVVWLNPANIVAIKKSKSTKYPNDTVVVTNAVYDNGEGDYYVLPCSPEKFIDWLGVEVSIFE